jgi:hypothetical protein
MMRHVYESIAMAALCCDKECQVLESFTKDRRRYPVDEAPSRLRRAKLKKRLAPLLGIDPEAWSKHLDKNVDFSGRSNATGLTLAFQVMLETEDQMVLGGEYDPGKDHAYRSDLRRIRSLANDIAAIVPRIASALKALQSN